MNFIIGLGNPGDQYKLTKHNFGFWVIDRLIQKRSLKIKVGKGDYVFAKDVNNVFVKPTGFMNNSGLAISNLLPEISSNDHTLIIYHIIN